MSTVTVAAPAPSRALHATLWVLQLALGLLFVMAGSFKAFTPMTELAAAMPTLHPAVIRVAGAADLLGGIGLVLPAATRILPWLTPLAAVGLQTVMVLAFFTHAAFGEYGALPVNTVLFTLLAVVAWGRAVKSPIHARG